MDERFEVKTKIMCSLKLYKSFKKKLYAQLILKPTLILYVSYLRITIFKSYITDFIQCKFAVFIRDFLRKGNTLFWNTQKFIQKKKNRFHVNVSPPLRFQRQYDFPQNLMTFHKILGLVMFLVFLEKSYVLGKGNLLFCCTCIWENYFGYFYLMFQFQGRHI